MQLILLQIKIIKFSEDNRSGWWEKVTSPINSQMLWLLDCGLNSKIFNSVGVNEWIAKEIAKRCLWCHNFWMKLQCVWDVLRECKQEIKKRLFCIWLRIFVVFPYQLYQASAVCTGGFRGTKSPSQRLLVPPISVNSEYFFETSCTDKTTGRNSKRNNNVQT